MSPPEVPVLSGLKVPDALHPSGEDSFALPHPVFPRRHDHSTLCTGCLYHCPGKCGRSTEQALTAISVIYNDNNNRRRTFPSSLITRERTRGTLIG